MDKRYIVWIILLIAALTVLLLVYKSQDVKRMYKALAQMGLDRSAALEPDILTEKDIAHLPEPVQKYLAYTGAIGKEKVRNMRVVMEGHLKMDRDKDWTPIHTQQYNFYNEPIRLYHIVGKINGLPVMGLDSYQAGKGNMLIKVAGLVKVVDAHDPKMDRAALVTVLNDMCLIAPATLIDRRLQWETVDAQTVKVTLEDQGLKVSGILTFNDKGELTNFLTYDRYFSPKGTTYESVPWSTPVRNYKDFNGIRINSYGEAIWHFPEGDFCYGKATTMEVEYNVKHFQ